jgi:hypothetical protein
MAQEQASKLLRSSSRLGIDWISIVRPAATASCLAPLRFGFTDYEFSQGGGDGIASTMNDLSGLTHATRRLRMRADVF